MLNPKLLLQDPLLLHNWAGPLRFITAHYVQAFPSKAAPLKKEPINAACFSEQSSHNSQVGETESTESTARIAASQNSDLNTTYDHECLSHS